jgi:type IV pilus assembly protein PilC
MPEFRFRAIDEKGREVKGKAVVNTSVELLEELKEKGYYILEVTEKERRKSFGRRKVKKRELISFTTQFYSLVSAGLPILKGLQDVAQEMKNPYFRRVLEEIVEKVEAGQSLSEAFSDYPDIFPRFYVGAIKTGEISGTLNSILKNLLDIMEKQEQFETELKQNLTYPVIAVLTLSGVAFFYLFYIFPKVLNLVKEMGVELPTQTKILLAFVNTLTKLWYVPILLLVGLVLAFFLLRKNEKFAFYLDSALLKVPFLGEIIKKSLMARFSRFLSLLLDAGIDIVTSLEILVGTIGNRVIRSMIERARELLIGGKGLADAFTVLPFNSISLSIIRVGEETGRLTGELLKVAEYNQRDVEARTKRLITLLEPIMLITFGLVAGLIFLSVLLPIYDTVSKVTLGP